MPKPNVREQLMEAGLRTLHTQGFNGCAVQDITQAAGVPKGSFYNHFESKEALAMAALELFWMNGTARRALLSDVTIEPVERLRRHFQMLSAALARIHYERGCMIGNFSSEMARNTQFRERLTKMYSDWSLALESCIEDVKAAGQLKVQLPPKTLAAFLVNSWEGAVLRSKVELSGDAFQDFEQAVFEGFFI
jgi:TetR/AcrR family transcriptional regulator, transcriptional repressor for nem operon